jgi:signal transduction histidine kinase
VPLLAGAWVRGQDRLQLELARAAGERDRARARDARQAAEEERMRIAADLEVAVAGRLSEIARTAPALRDRLGRGGDAAAGAPFSDIAAAAREALADVRRVLGILRRAGDRAPRAPAAPSASLRVAAAATPAPGSGMDVAPPPRRRVPSAADAALAAAVLVGAEAELALRVPADERLIAALTPLPIAAALLARRARPVPAALALLGAIAVQSLLLRPEFFPVANMAAVCCASYAIGAHTSQRTAAGGGALVALAVAAHALAFHPQGVWIALLAAVAVPWGLGRVIRGQRRATRAAHDRAGAVERRRERDARAAVTAERMRVARELHDAVAHNVSVIAIQAAGAEGLVAAGDPRRAAEIAGLIETVARDALAELGRLRGGVPPDAPPGLAEVRELAERTREGGLPVEVRIEGEPGRLPAGIDLAGFRIVQEALANASKHAGRARARVVVRYGPRAVELEIADDGRAPAPERRARAGSGHGLVGMRERVAIYGGTLDAGRRAGGGFTVRARLPLEGA